MSGIECPECGSPLILRESRYGKFYGCSRYPDCQAAHGAHPNGKPLGIPGDKTTKQARIDAHAAFDRLWKSGPMTRKMAYKWLAEEMNLSKHEAHIGRFNRSQCLELIEKIKGIEL